MTLAPEECLLYGSRLNYTADTFAVEHGSTYRVKEHLKEFRVDGETLATTIPVVYLVVADLEEFAAPFRERGEYVEGDMVYHWRGGFDMAD